MKVSLTREPAASAAGKTSLSPAARALGQSPRMRAQRASLDAAFGASGSPVQRVLIAQRDPASVPLPPGATAKLQEVIALTNAMGAHIVPNLTVNIRIDARDDMDPSPAYTNAAGNTIDVEIAAWFVKLASVGDLAGMLAHEIGVHTLADQLMTPVEEHQEQVNEVNDFSQKVGLFTHTVTGWSSPGQNWGADGRQRDHTNVVRDTGLGATPANRRTGVYVETSLHLANEAYNRYIHNPARQTREVRDILQSFLFDYARILVTNDGKAPKIFSTAHYIGDVFNWYRDVVVRRYSGQYPWLNNQELLPSAGGWRLRGYLLDKLASMIAVRLNDTRVGRSMVGKGVRGVGKVIDYGLIKPTKAIAGLPGIKHTLNAAGHVAGFGARWTEAGLKAAFGGTWWLAKKLYSAVRP
jgi:hypothetical protein